MKKSLIFLSIATSFVLLATSCKKDDTPANPNIEGYWVGSQGAELNALDNQCAAIFRSNGTLRIYFINNNDSDTAAAAKADGTYTTSLPGTVKGAFKFDNNTQQSFEAKLSADFKNMVEGTFGVGTNVGGAGFFEMHKTN